jgi:phospholipid transport system substrate-binding protein
MKISNRRNFFSPALATTIRETESSPFSATRMIRHIVLLTGLAFVLVTSDASAARSATEQVKSSMDKIISILNAPETRGDKKKTERRRLIIEEIDQRFDWAAIARGCLGRHWAKANPQQREEFLDVFRRFLERTYLDKIEPYYNELLRIDYQAERIVENNYASVKTVVVTRQNIAHPVEYRLEKSASGEWKIYDAVIEGVSLVKNYRVQFDEIVSKSSFNELIADLRLKIAPTNNP